MPPPDTDALPHAEELLTIEQARRGDAAREGHDGDAGDVGTV